VSVAALKTISFRLQNDPVNFGEETFDLLALKITVKVAVVRPLAVEFGIHPTANTIWIRSFR